MERLRPLPLLRLAGLLACMLSGVATVAVEAMGRPISAETLADFLIPGDWSRASRAVLQGLGFLALGASFLAATQPRHWSRADSANIRLVAPQTALALLFAPELLYVVAAEASFLLPFPSAVRWVLLQSACEVGSYIYLNAAAGLRPYPGLEKLPPSFAWPLIVFGSLIWHLVAFSLGLLGSVAARQARDLAAANAELRATQELAAETARVADRVHFARELHDAVGHHLTALSVNLQVAARLAESAEPKLRDKIDQTHLVTRALLGEIRAMVSGWNGSESVGLRPALEALARQIEQPRIEVRVEPEAEQVSPAVGHALFRAAQELITNALRHAGASSIEVSATRRGDDYELTVSDSGAGQLPLVFGNGLTGVSRRLEQVSGQLLIEANQPRGLRAVVRVPAAGGGEAAAA